MTVDALPSPPLIACGVSALLALSAYLIADYRPLVGAGMVAGLALGWVTRPALCSWTARKKRS